ncbi:MAG TPA: thiamine phosphate synthase [Acidobacteriota bacterium]|nr:thiamine phosphate synthase [Acidobacteriota bacterium]HNG91239.1 thiamine phosphate synthase [Acidobacteriota bacterium]HNJ39813.1 thiamine phosphate synthase [Acidobacteriota bacterium]
MTIPSIEGLERVQPMALPPLYAITDQPLTGLSHLELVKHLIAGGATLIQLRDKVTDGRTFYELAHQVMEYARPHGVKIIINDRVDIALAVNADGVHVGQDDLPPAAARQLLGPSKLIGYSTHSLDQALEADQFPIDYIAVGPVFQTQTKENPSPVVGLELVRRVATQVSKPVVAIGGIPPERISEVLQAGATSVALISGLLLPVDSLAGRTRSLLSALCHQGKI